ncbi:MAG: CPBP family intramembrane metalloprotease [Oculatellaceae cyanobacterium Prado106]|jgi:hypothetical protein|nr:CPBP family intramembrane metalloprotease [Oculatellaceae cyanobacterium Prado106]
MRIAPANASRYQIPLIALVPFLLMTFGLAWGLFAIFILLPKQMVAIFGILSGQHPLFILAVWAPAIAAFITVISYAGIAGLWRYLSRLFLWHCPPAWCAFVWVGIPLLFYGGAALKGNLFTEPFPFSLYQSLILALATTSVIGPIEEFGWRGLALPLLQRRFAPIWAGLILGLIWGIWHLPAFLLSGTPQSTWSFPPFLIGSVAISIIITPLFNASHGSILLPFLVHFQLNNPLWPDAQPYDTLFFVAAAVLVIWINRKTMFRRGDIVTDVIPPSRRFTAS